ncbi:serine/threonine-protein kinase Nek1 isoform X2 [Amblyraja radiata]|uniref:serine/threonine-protein kinase Nek1 isoform X2 n=1 Tax=Amblyraja radiata TaxID=386614 RepID=UPI0014037C79|nr:serine/threonine-protein kinase Nek1 isoform X2 [Amblyraja radiata]
MSSMDKYTKVNKIGEGSFGKAILVTSNENGRQYVIKEISISRMSNKEREESRREVAVLANMKHPNIVQYKESFEESGCLYIVMDYCEGGDLFKRINTQKGILFPEEKILDWFVQICLALKHVHDRKILHRDIKSQNIFLTKDGTVQLGDFGIARVLNSTVELARTCIGTPYYLSPEICENKPYNNKSDIWALGCVLYEMCTLKHAFEAGNMKNLVLKIIRGSYPPVSVHYSYDLRNLMSQLFKRNPRDRPSVSSLLQKPFLVKRVDKLLLSDLIVEEFGHAFGHHASKPVIPNAAVKRPGPVSGSIGPAQKITKPAAKYKVPLTVKSAMAAKKPEKKLLMKHKQAQPTPVKKMNGVNERRKMFEEVFKKKKQEQIERERKQRDQMNLLKAEQMRRMEKDRMERINRAREQGWRHVLGVSGSLGSGEHKVPFSGGGGGGSGGILPAANNGQRYEHYHAILDHMQQQKENIKVFEEKGLKWNMETPPRERVHGGVSAAAGPGIPNGAGCLHQLPDAEAIRREVKRLENVAKHANVYRQRGHAAAERAKQVEEFWQRKREALQNKARGEGHLGILQNLAAIYGGRSISTGRGKSRTKEEEEYLGRLRQIRLQNFNERQEIKAKLRGEKCDSDGSDGQESSDEAEFKRKKIEALKAQANTRAAVLKEQLEKKRREAYERERKAWDEHLAAKGFKQPVTAASSSSSQGRQGSAPSSKPQSPAKSSTPAISMTAALKDVGIAKETSTPKEISEEIKRSSSTTIQKEKQDILRRLNQNIKTQDSPDSDAGDKGTVWQGDSAVTSPGNGPQPEAQLEDGPHLAGERKKWEAEPPPVIPLAQLTLEDTGSEINYETCQTSGEVIKLYIKDEPRKVWEKEPSDTVLKVLGEADLQIQTGMLMDTITIENNAKGPLAEVDQALTVVIDEGKGTDQKPLSKTFEAALAGTDQTSIAGVTMEIKIIDLSRVEIVQTREESIPTLKPSVFEDKIEEPEDLETEALDEGVHLNRDNVSMAPITVHAWEKESDAERLLDDAVSQPEKSQEPPVLAEEKSIESLGSKVNTEGCASETPESEPFFHKLPPLQDRKAMLMRESSQEDTLGSKPLFWSLSPANSKGKRSLLIGLSTGLFDANNPKMLRTCSLPDLNKMFKTYMDDSVPDAPEDNLELDDIEDEPIKDEYHSDSDTLFGEADTDDLQELQASMERLLHEQPSEEFSEEEEEVASNSSPPEGSVYNVESSMNGAEGEEDENPASSSDQSAIHEEWHSDDSEEDVAGESAEFDSVFSRLEELRMTLEQEMGFENFIEAYNKVKAIHEDEDENIDIGTPIVQVILGPQFEHLYSKILHLVMADGAYQEDNDE